MNDSFSSSSQSRRNKNRAVNTAGTSGTPSGGNHHGNGSGGRKMNANHLLNFSMPSRPAPLAPPPRRSRRTGGGEGARWQVFNKEKFVNASFRFMMKPTGDYTAHFADSDIFFNWPDILQILIPPARPTIVDGVSLKSHDAVLPSCPICLGDPVAPRMTKCGHVYCFSCILHFLALSDERFGKCPICTDNIFSKDLKCVSLLDPNLFASSTPTSISRPTHSTTPNSTSQTFRLVHRPHNTMLSLPHSGTWPSAAIHPHEAPFFFVPDVSAFARFMLASPEYIISQLDHDLQNLEAERRQQASAGEADVGLGFINAAMMKVKEQMERAGLELDTETVRRKIRTVEGAVTKARESAQRILDREESMKIRQQAAESQPIESISVAPTHSSVEPLFPSKEYSPASLDLSTFSAPPSDNPSAIESPILTSNLIPHAFLSHQGHTWSTDALPVDSPTPLTKQPSLSNPSDTSSSTSPKKSLQPRPPVRPRTGSALLPSAEPSFYFYQAVDGQHIYLHPLDIRVLLAEYKSYASFPQLLELTVEGAEEGTMNEDLRRRCKYLAHLPTGCAITFIQVDLTRLASKSVLAQFEAPLRQRRQRRKDKGKKEEREKKKAEEKEREEEELQRLNLSRDHSFPSWTPRAGAGGGGGGGGGDDFEEALERSLWEAEHTEPRPTTDLLHPSASSPTLTTSPSSSSTTTNNPSGWSGRSFASTIHTSEGIQSWGRSRSTYGQQSQVDEEEVAALWKKFESSQAAERKWDGGASVSTTSAGGGPVGVEGTQADGSQTGQSRGGKKGKKAKGQKLLLTGGGRGF
ncbi:Predicted E3 ubiquitin ligase [Phaffia rhodozyma]|uniref:Predicted E3 ubiquitin ligase n=1 Tax=Phaffia rhodozyma TaxID=264483 RepID=A0A0F7SHR5_PHARH|nr:Predicted E3 ubiquitin ligase [Phaffia rhodozyma]